MSLFLILSLIITLVTLFLGIIVFLRKPKDTTNCAFFLIIIGGLWWSTTNLFIDFFVTDLETALFLSKLTILGPLLLIPATLYLSIIFPDNERFTTKRFLIFIPSLLFIPFLLTQLNIEKVWLENGQISFRPGILYYCFLTYLLIYFSIIFYNFLKRFRNCTLIKKSQIEYLLTGLFLSLFVGTTTNVILPIFGYNQLLKIGPSLSLISFAGFTSYAIVAKQLFDIKVILTSLFTSIIATLLLFNALSSTTTFEYIWKGSLFVIFLIFGYMLIKSVRNEVRQRERMEEMAKELALANIKLKKLDRAKSEFLSIASHQLRTPLAAIGGYLSMILEGTYGKISEKIRRPVANVFKASRQLNQLVNTLLNVSRIEAGKIKLEAKKMSIASLLKPIVEEFKIVAQKKDLYLKLSMPADMPMAMIDQGKMNQVIMNIIDNAIKYTSKGGIDVSVNLKRGESGQKVLIEIKDTGAGMDQQQISQIFEKFKRGTAGKTSWSKGAGLGLFIAKKFIEIHKGKIWAQSKGIGKGTTFFIELPLK